MSLVDKDDRAHSVSVRMAHRGRHKHKHKPVPRDRKVEIEQRASRGLAVLQTESAMEDTRRDGFELDVQCALLDEWAERARKHGELKLQNGPAAEVSLEELIVGPFKTKRRTVTDESQPEFEVLVAPSAAHVRALDDVPSVDGPEPQDDWDYLDEDEHHDGKNTGTGNKISYAKAVIQGLG